MHNSAATLDECGPELEQRHAAMSQDTITSDAAPREAAKVGGGKMKFAYSTGARPLEGYTIKRGIGIGGFGDVYFALSDAGKELALKRIQRNMDVEVRGVTQCINLKHPNLVALFDIKYDDEGQAWVVMEYVCGDSLRDGLDRNPNGMPIAEAYDWFRGIASGVAYLHDHGIVHRDLKPGNIFIDEDVVKIGDYGLSKYISCSRRSGQTESVGTFHYMAPEIGKGIYGKEIDIYALGIIFFEMLTGHVPFEGESSQEIIMKHLTADPDLSDVPQAFRSVIQRALFKDPDQRFTSVGEMLGEVEIACGLAPAPQSVSVNPKPPIIQPVQVDSEPLYIGDEYSDEGIEFGELKEKSDGTTPFRTNGRNPQAEPIAEAVRVGVRRTTNWWQHGSLSTTAKVLFLIVAMLVLGVAGSQAVWLLPIAIFLGAMYLVYYGIRSLVLALDSSGTSAATASPDTLVANSPAQYRRRRKNWKRAAREQLARKHGGERMTELSGALLTSAFVSLVLCFVMMLVVRGEALDEVFTWTAYAWLSITSIAGAWAVLAISKLWESDEGESFGRRFVMLIAGLITGSAAFGAGQFLDVNVVGDMTVNSLPGFELPASMYGSDGSLTLPVFLVYFAGLFVILRWWIQADPLRETRVSLWATAACVLWAWLIHIFWPFPQPWGFMLAATISIAVQLSAPWISYRDRARIRDQVADVV